MKYFQKISSDVLYYLYIEIWPYS